MLSFSLAGFLQDSNSTEVRTFTSIRDVLYEERCLQVQCNAATLNRPLAYLEMFRMVHNILASLQWPPEPNALADNFYLKKKKSGLGFQRMNSEQKENQSNVLLLQPWF